MQITDRSVSALVILGLLVLGAFILFIGRTPTPSYAPSPPAATATRRNVLPADLSVFSGRVIDRSETSITVEWSKPTTVDASDIQKMTKHITWTGQTLFEREPFGAPSAGRAKIQPAEIAVGDAVQISTVETVQDHYELTAWQVRVMVPARP